MTDISSPEGLDLSAMSPCSPKTPNYLNTFEINEVKLSNAKYIFYRLTTKCFSENKKNSKWESRWPLKRYVNRVDRLFVNDIYFEQYDEYI